VLTNLRRVGLRGLGGTALALARDVRDGWESSGARTAYLIERTGPTAALDGHQESLPATIVAQLLGLQDFVAMLPELSARRAKLQRQRRRSDAEIVSRFGDHWQSAVPSPHLDLHIALRDRMLEVLRVQP
jgi:hypothetical protein